eukprot:TRINITY_DN37056_c0_g1_i1.p1 TRINITY_DN37056_c0_g1~~TRINITY_DN37056_c0_g1_i1.p1  ORF type:complete len:648 (-),score=105.17 TRINITY_DN37056_c0_g1_i1:45-1928(-)
MDDDIPAIKKSNSWHKVQLCTESLRAVNSSLSPAQKRRRIATHYSKDSHSSLADNEQNAFFAAVVSSPLFDKLVAVAILLNMVVVGLEQSYDLQERYPRVMMAIESIFLLIYMGELACRFLGRGFRRSLRENWVRFDIVLLVIGVVTTWLLSPFVIEIDTPALSNVGMLRAARFGRLARMARLVLKFRSLWMLVQGLMSSARIMFSVLIVLTCIVYMFASMGFDIIGRHSLLSSPDADAEFVEAASKYFSSLSSSMLTILSFLVFDSVRQIYWPLVAQDHFLVLYFLAVIFTIGIVLANLITAVVVNSAIEQASEDRDARAHEEMQLREEFVDMAMQLFRSLDEDNSGILTREEVAQISERDAALLEELIQLKDPVELFDVLDLDDSGEVDMQEFLKVIHSIAFGQNMNFLKLAKTLKQMHGAFYSESKSVLAAVNALSEKVDEMSAYKGQGPLSPRSSYATTAPAIGDIITSEWVSETTSYGDVELRASRQHRLDANPIVFPESAPSWASIFYENLLDELNSSTDKILQALFEDSPTTSLHPPPPPEEDDEDGAPQPPLRSHHVERRDVSKDGVLQVNASTDGTLQIKPRTLRICATRADQEACYRPASHACEPSYANVQQGHVTM